MSAITVRTAVVRAHHFENGLAGWIDYALFFSRMHTAVQNFYPVRRYSSSAGGLPSGIIAPGQYFGDRLRSVEQRALSLSLSPRPASAFSRSFFRILAAFLENRSSGGLTSTFTSGVLHLGLI